MVKATSRMRKSFSIPQREGLRYRLKEAGDRYQFRFRPRQ